MKRMTMWLAAVMLLAFSMTARAEVYVNREPPEDWSERKLLRLIAIDTDRSDAMMLLCGGEAMMVDGGAGGYQQRLYDTADAYGVTAFKYLFNTHCDNDHIHGLKYLMESERYQVDMFTSTVALNYQAKSGFQQMTAMIIRKLNIPYHVVEDGETLTLGGASMTVMRCMEPWGLNARSATLMVTFGNSRVFLTGDIDNLTMRHYVEKYGAEALRAEIMKAPHHGIATIPDKFIAAVDPALVFVPNMSEQCAGFIGGMRLKAPDATLLFSGDADIVMETDGEDWYVFQTLPEPRT